MAWLPPAFAILIALFGSTAHAGPPAVPRAHQAGFYLPGCCVGTAEVLDDLGSDSKLFCPRETANNLDRVRVIVAYIEARPERMKEGFGASGE